MATPAKQPNKKPSKSYYGKRPLWQWILLYLIIGGVVYAVVYFLFFANGYKY